MVEVNCQSMIQVSVLIYIIVCAISDYFIAIILLR